jgi:ubiquinone/menaquinone biosynthesis C-methylase UbiE
MEGRVRLIKAAVASLCLSAGAVILDVAAGGGELSALIQSWLGGTLIANDWSMTEALAAEAAGHLSLRADARRLPVPDAVADLVIAFEIIEHFSLADARALIDELHRVTKPGGTVLISTPNRYSLESWKGMTRYLVNGTVWNARDETHVTLFSRNGLARAVERRFEVQRTLGYYLLPEVRGRATPWTYVVSTNPAVTAFCHKLLIVARRPDEPVPAT